MRNINLDLNKLKKIVYELDENGNTLIYTKETVDVDGEMINQTKWELNSKDNNFDLTDLIFLKVSEDTDDFTFRPKKKAHPKEKLFNNKEYTSRIKYLMDYWDAHDKAPRICDMPYECCSTKLNEILEDTKEEETVTEHETSQEVEKVEKMETEERFEDKVARKYKNYKWKKKNGK